MFENKFFFWLFLAIPIISLIFIADILLLRKKSKLLAGKNVASIIPFYTEGQKWLRLIFYILGFALAVLALARPRWGVETIETEVKGRDILLILDVSYSMAANDVVPSRLDSAKRYIVELLEMETGDRIGLSVFSGAYELVSPITHDYAAINFFTESLYPGMLGKGGTNIGDAIINGIDSFDDTEPRNKMIVLITDGEDIEGPYYQMLKKAKESKIKVFTVGVGTKSGEPIPIRNAKGEIESYVKDENNKHVISKLDEKRLIEIAESSGGSYLKTSNKKGELKKFIETISSVESEEQKELKYEQKKERYDIFLIPALIFFAIGFILDQGRIIRSSKNRLSWLLGKNTMITIFVSLMLLTSNYLSFSQTDPSDDVSDKNTTEMKDNKSAFGDPNGGFWGNRKFKKGDLNKALEKYASAINHLHENQLAKLYYNIGNTYLKLNDYKNAAQYYETAGSFAKEDSVKSKIFYNMGLVAFKNNDFANAKNFFKESIKLNELDDDARYNYQIAELMDEKTKKDNKQEKQEQKDNKQSEENKDENQDKNKDEEQKLSKEDIEKLLKSLDEKEKNENRDKTLQEQKGNNQRGKYW